MTNLDNLQNIAQFITDFSIFGDSVEMIRITYLIGILLAFVYRRRNGYNPGGLIVPGSVALVLNSSVAWFILQLIATVLVYYVYQIFFAKKALTDRYPVLIFSAISVFVMGICSLILKLSFGPNIDLYISFVSPGLIASVMHKRSGLRVYWSAFYLSLLTAILAWIVYRILPASSTLQLTELNAGREMIIINLYEIQVLFSIILSLIAYHYFKVRVGGMVLLPIASALLLSPVHFLICAAVTMLTWGILHILQYYSFFVGISRFSISFLLAITIAWSIELILLNISVNYNIWMNFSPLYRTSLLVPLLSAAWVNDVHVQKPLKAVYGITGGLLAMASFTIILNILFA